MAKKNSVVRSAESTPVTLARMEGKLDNVIERVSDLRAEVTHHEGLLVGLRSDMQQVQSDITSADEARTLAAAAVKAADEARVAAAKAQVDNSTQRWTPAMRLYASLGGIASVAATIYYITHPHG
jgi:peptidoglycan hydrolase CwlO-like protein